MRAAPNLRRRINTFLKVMFKCTFRGPPTTPTKFRDGLSAQLEVGGPPAPQAARHEGVFGKAKGSEPSFPSGEERDRGPGGQRGEVVRVGAECSGEVLC